MSVIAPADEPATIDRADEAILHDHFRRVVGDHPTVGLALGVVGNDGTWHFRGHGVTDIATREPITEHTVFRIASITKTFTAIAIMQLWERGLIDLDAPANDYLRSYELIPASSDFAPASVRHLLTHTAGLPETARVTGIVRPDFGESWPAGSPAPTLTEFYRGGIRVGAEPGTRFVYNNHGPATLGQIVEDVTGEPLADYLRDHILVPLGMADSDLRRTERLERRRATGYEIGRRGVREIAERDMVTAGAASMYSTPADMARYLRALLGHGTNEHGSVLAADTTAMMFDAHYLPDPRLPGMGLGFFRTDLGGRIAVGHQGSHPGFHSQVLVVPDAGRGAMAFTNGAHQADLWLSAEVSGLLRRLLDISTEERRFAPNPAVWRDLCGWYRLAAGLTDVRLRSVMGLGAEVYVRGGELRLRFMTPIPQLAAGLEMIPDDDHDPYVFRVDLSDTGLEPMRIAFRQDGNGTTTQMCLDIMPLVLDKRPPTTNPRRWAISALAGGAAIAVARRLGS